MKRWLSLPAFVVVSSLALGVILLTGANHAYGVVQETGCNVGSIRFDRVDGGSLFEFATGTAYDDARAELADPANFSPTGIVDQEFQLLPAIFDVTASNLASVDIFWAGLILDSALLSSTEQQALLDFVAAGGALVVVADVPAKQGPNSAAAPFGVSWGASGASANPTVTDASHPIINGPFGVVTTIQHADEASIDNLGTNAQEIASNAPGSSIAQIPPGVLGPGSGPVVFFSDVNEFTSNVTAYGVPFDLADNRVLFRNLFAHLAVVCEEPTPTPTPTPTPIPTATPPADEDADVLPPTGSQPAGDEGFPWPVVGVVLGGLVLLFSGVTAVRLSWGRR